MGAGSKIDAQELQKQIDEQPPFFAFAGTGYLPVRADMSIVELAARHPTLVPPGPSIGIDDDFHGWLLEQASALRARRYLSLDWERLAEELEAMAVAERRELLRRLTTLLGHLLKLRYQPRPKSERRRILTVVRARTEIHRILAGSPGLKGQLEALVADAYSDTRRETGIEIGLARRDWEQLFPEKCPWSVDLILDADFVMPAN